MDLSGPWRIAARSAELDRAGADPDLDDDDWDVIHVPGHWGEHPQFLDAEGPLLYRRNFSAEAPQDGHRAWLRFDGVMSEAEVWLDGEHLDDTNVYFTSHRFEITDQLKASTNHALAVEVSNPPPGEGAKRSMTGSLQSGPLAPPGSPGGIWRGVGIDTTGPAAIVSARLLCTEATRTEASLQFRMVIDAVEAGEVRVDTSIVGPDGTTAGGVITHAVASGENHIEWTSTIENPDLWWPAAMGSQPRYDVGVAVRTLDGKLSDRRGWRTGIRTVEVDDMLWKVNGEPIFVKGIAVGPHGRFLGSVDADRLTADVALVADAGLDLIRIQGHVTRQEFYDAADDLGVLIWQDLPLIGTYNTRSRRTAAKTARAVVDELGHHPSIAVWCGHDEPNGPPLPTPNSATETIATLSKRLGRHFAPSWNRSILDPMIRKELRSSDPTRAVITRSGSLPNLVDVSRSDSHLWLGWHAGLSEDLAELLKRWPRLGAFIGTIGSQSVVIADWSEQAPTFTTAQQAAFDRYLPRTAYCSGVEWAHATQAYQAEIIRTQIETLRRLKYSPTGGFCVVSLFDAEPDGGFGIVDIERQPKLAFDALAQSCRPLIIVADQPVRLVTPGEVVSLAVHAVNDSRRAVTPVRVRAIASIGDWREERTWEGRIEADSVTFIGNIEFQAPPITGALIIELELTSIDDLLSNRYQTVVIPPSEALSRPQSHLRPR